MIVDFDKIEDLNKIELSKRVRAVLGVPKEILTDDTISSPVFSIKANRYINSKIKEYDDLDKALLTISYIYYICYCLCSGMYARLPKQMKNVSTETVLQSINWDSKALEMLDKCNETLESAIEAINEDVEYGNSFAVLSSESEYPNTNI